MAETTAGGTPAWRGALPVDAVFHVLHVCLVSGRLLGASGGLIGVGSQDVDLVHHTQTSKIMLML